jgi:DNA-binding transcriptional ArsR family regulator
MLESLRQFKAGIFQALGHPTRVAIVEFLNYREMSVGQLCEKIGVEQSNASQHLAVLRNKGVVQTRKDGNLIYYSLRDPAFGQVLQILRTFFLEHLNEALEMLRQEQDDTDHEKRALRPSKNPAKRPAHR